MKMSQANELIDYAKILKDKGELEAIQGIVDTVAILFKDNDEIAQETRITLSRLIEEAN